MDEPNSTTDPCVSSKNKEMSVFASNLSKAVDASGRTDRDIAAAVGVSISTFSGYLAGEKAPRLDVAARIAKELGVSIDHLMGLRQDGETDLKSAATTLHISETSAFRIASVWSEIVDVLMSSNRLESAFVPIELALNTACMGSSENAYKERVKRRKRSIQESLTEIQLAGFYPLSREGSAQYNIRNGTDAINAIFNEECAKRFAAAEDAD